MTTWSDWHSWTYFVIGNDIASKGLIVDLDFPARKLRYLRQTGRSYDANPYPLGTPEYEAYLYDTIEAHYDHVWVDPQKSLVLSCEDYDCLIVQRKKPASFVELIDVDPRDFFCGDVQITSTYLRPSLLAELNKLSDAKDGT